MKREMLYLQTLHDYTNILKSSAEIIISKDRYKDAVKSNASIQIYQEFSKLPSEYLLQFIEYIQDEKILEEIPLVNFLIMGFLEFNSEESQEKENITKRIEVLSLLIPNKTEILNRQLYPAGPSPLSLAILSKSLEIVKFLVDEEQDLGEGLKFLGGIIHVEESVNESAIATSQSLAIFQYLLLKQCNIKMYNMPNDIQDLIKEFYGKYKLIIELIDSPSQLLVEIAVYQGNLDVIKRLKRLGQDLHRPLSDLNYYYDSIHNRSNESLLSCAAGNQHIDIVQYALDEGMDLHINFAIRIAANVGNFEIFKLLSARGASYNGEDYYGQDIVHLTAKGGNVQILEQLCSAGVKLDNRDLDSNLALHFAAARGHVEIIKFLIDKGVNKNANNFYGRTCLFFAVYHGHLKLVEYLLSIGEPVPTDILIQCDSLRFYWKLLDERKKDYCNIIKLLTTSGANINSQDEGGETLMHYAMYKGCFEIVEVLLSLGADVNIRDVKGNTPLTRICSETKSDKETNSYKTITLLLKCGANPDIKNNEGFSARDYASRDPKSGLKALLDDYSPLAKCQETDLESVTPPKTPLSVPKENQRLN